MNFYKLCNHFRSLLIFTNRFCCSADKSDLPTILRNIDINVLDLSKFAKLDLIILVEISILCNFYDVNKQHSDKMSSIAIL